MSSFCKNVQFDNQSDNKIFMVSQEVILRIDILLEKIEIFYDFKSDMQEQPDFFIFNDDQSKCVFATENDALIIDLVNKIEIDIDKQTGISCIRTVYSYN